MKLVIVLAAICVGAQADSFSDLVADQWEAYKLTHQKKYESDTEERFRMKIFIENLDKVAKHNQIYELGLVSYKLKVNKWADMLHHEFVQTLNGFNRTNTKEGLSGLTQNKYEHEGLTFIPPANVKLPERVDWRESGAVTAVKDQNKCGACWSFSATGSLEGQHFRKSNKLVSLSEQNLIDCSTKYGNNGCHGGLMNNAFEYIKQNRGIDTETSYPYEADEDECRYNPTNSGASDRGYMHIESENEDHLKSAVSTVGPIAVGLDASHPSLQLYAEGIYYEPECSNTKLDHAMLLVGFGTDDTGADYWLLKNSWGETWGVKGYVKFARNRKNNCGVATLASFPLV